ncbi:MAG: hypothetical protein IJK81_13640 [Selenomonadaceae bacterium]|nr:hypothetical protein [Selenomonadaceae bacterium]
MEIYLKGTPNEINDFLYGERGELDAIAENDNPNIPIGDDEEVDAAKIAISDLANFITEKRKELTCSKSVVDYTDLVFEVMKRVRAYAKVADEYIK